MCLSILVSLAGTNVHSKRSTIITHTSPSYLIELPLRRQANDNNSESNITQIGVIVVASFIITD